MIGFIYIHPLTIASFILIAFTSFKSRFFVLYLFIFLHELSHMLVSLLVKEKVSALKLFPWGCTLQLSSLPNKTHNLLILSAGPLFNLIMFLLGIFPYENLSLALFNLIPVMPLDGGVILNTIFPKKSFYISLSFILSMAVFCVFHHIFPALPICLASILFLGEQNRFEKSINYKITLLFKSEK